MRADLHVHTTASVDSAITVRTLMRMARSRGLDAVAVTDHDCAKAWPEAVATGRRAGMQVILGQEVKTRSEGRRTGEVIGLFLTDPLKGGTLAETLDQIASQGGVSTAPHPCDSVRSSLGERARRAGGKLNALETLNGRAYLKSFNARADALADELGLAKTGGSDAHFPVEVGRCVTVCEGDSPEDLRKAILARRTSVEGRVAGAWCHLASGLRQMGLIGRL